MKDMMNDVQVCVYYDEYKRLTRAWNNQTGEDVEIPLTDHIIELMGAFEDDSKDPTKSPLESGSKLETAIENYYNRK